jgi:hypothetical protein
MHLNEKYNIKFTEEELDRINELKFKHGLIT